MSSQPDPVPSGGRWRRSALGFLAGLAVAAAIAVPTTLAAITKPGPAGTTGPTVTKPAPAGSTAPTGTTKTPAPGGTGTAPDPVFTSAIAQLEQAGTIDSAQAQAIDAQLQSKSFELQQLVDSGIITAAQAQAVQNALRQAKMSLSPTNGTAGTANVRHVGRHRHVRRRHRR
jgi:hypothetical protein